MKYGLDWVRKQLFDSLKNRYQNNLESMKVSEFGLDYVLYAKKEKIHPAYVPKHNWNREKQFILSMIPNGERHVQSNTLRSETLTTRAKSKGRWHYLAVKKLSALLRRIRSKYHGDFYCLNCFQSFATEKKRESHKRYVEIMIFLTLWWLLKALKY